jgi:hypothetical protein
LQLISGKFIEGRKMTEDKKNIHLERRKKLLEMRAEEVEKLNTDVRERLIFLIYLYFTKGSRYESLEKRYGISARRWQNVCNRAQMPGTDMICSIVRDHPNYATWLLLGEALNVEKTRFSNIPGGQIHPCVGESIHQTEEGLIDPTIKGWEKKLEKARWLAFIKDLPPEEVAKYFPKPESVV